MEGYWADALKKIFPEATELHESWEHKTIKIARVPEPVSLHDLERVRELFGTDDITVEHSEVFEHVSIAARDVKFPDTPK